MQRLTAHLRDVGETYTEHMACAAGFAWTLFTTALASAVHAVFPFWFVHTASRRVLPLAERLRERGKRAAPRLQESAPEEPVGEPAG